MSQASSNSAQSTHLKVFSPSFLSTTKKPELLKNLMELSDVLSSTSQDPADRPRGLHLTANQIVSHRIMEHSDKDVRLLAACCAVDILRIYAPEAPYKDEELIRVFKVAIMQMRGLATNGINTGSGMKMFYILSSLSIVKSCVVLVGLTKSSAPGAEELLLDMFDALLTTIQSDHPSEVSLHMSSVLQACLEEMDSVEQDVLEMLLQPLTPANKTENLAAYTLSQSVLRRTAVHLDNPLSNFLNTLLLAEGQDTSSAFHENVYALIYELHKVSANLLLKVLPNVCYQLQLLDEEVRLKAVKLLGKLFASPHAEYGIQHGKNFRDFLRRGVDCSVKVRFEFIASCANIMRKKPALREAVEESLIKRVRDADEDVRLAAVTSLLEVALEDPCALTAPSYLELAERMKDKRQDLRKLSMTGLAKVFSKHVCPLFPALDESRVQFSAADALEERFHPVYQHILSCSGYPDMSTRLTLVHLLQENFLPLDAESKEDLDRHRAAALLYLFKNMSSVDRTALAHVLSFKNKVRGSVLRLLQVRHAQFTSKTAEATEEVKTALYSLMSLVAPADKKHLIHDKFMAIKDKHVFRLLARAVDASDSMDDLIESKEDLKSRLDSKSAVGEYFSTIFELCCFGIANKGAAAALLVYAKFCADTEDESDDAAAAAELLVLLSKYAAQIFEGAAGLVEAWLAATCTSENATLVHACVSVIKNTATSLVKNDEDSAIALSSLCLKHCQRAADRSECESFATAAAHLANQGASSAVLSTMATLAADKKLSPSNKRLAMDMFALAALLRECSSAVNTSVFATHALDQLKEVILKAPSLDCQTIGAVLKLWTSACYVLERQREGSGAAAEIIDAEEIGNVLPEDIAVLTDTLYECIYSKGESCCGYQFDEEAERAFLRETSALSVLQLLRLKVVGKNLDVNQWHYLGWSLLDPQPGTRRTLSTALNILIQTHVVAPRILALPCLLANDDVLSSAAEGALTIAVNRLRRTHQMLCDHAPDDHMRKLAEDNMPETILPYALHLLSHHPDFPSSAEIDDEQDKRRMKAVMKSVSMILGVLLSGPADAAGNNLSYLFKQIQMITQFYSDKIDPGNLGLSFVTRLTRKLLNEKIRSAENVQAYPADINLPMDLYELCDLQDEKEGEAAEKAVERAYTVVGASKGSKKRPARAMTPVKAVKAKATISRKPKAVKAVEDDEEEEEEESREVERVVKPTRSGRITKAVKYTEVDEDEREVQRWNEAAGVATKPRKSVTPSQENVFDYREPRKSHKSSASKSIKTSLSTEEEVEDDEAPPKKRVLKEINSKRMKSTSH